MINDRYDNYRDSQKQINRLRLQKIPALNPRQKMKEEGGRTGIKN